MIVSMFLLELYTTGNGNINLGQHSTNGGK
jgi:hypothetical protein